MASSQLSPSNHPSAPDQSSTTVGSDFAVDVAAFNALPPHIHEKLTRASIELLAERLKPESVEPHESTLHPGNSPCPENTPVDKRKESKVKAERLTLFWNSIDPAGPLSYSHRSQNRFGYQQSNRQGGVQIQIDYLDFQATHIPNAYSLERELQAKERLRISLTKVAQEALELYGDMCGLPVGPNAIALKCLGGLRSGFSLPGEDLDLMIYKRSLKFSGELETDFLLILARSLLDAGFGARIIPETKGPVIRLCEQPIQELLNKLKSEHGELQSQKALGTNLELFGRSSNLSRAQPEGFRFPEDAGIQCNVNLQGMLSIHSTELLRCYALCDERVRQVAIFIKLWAKRRGICNPQYGTLCSYGYILMVIHYLTNVTQPPVVPNLQVICGQFPGEKSTAVVNGYEIQYCSDEAVLRSRSRYNAKFGNQQSVGDLVRGFFAYYGRSGRDAPLRGFHWARNTVSIRTQGGIVPKFLKGWTSWKTDTCGRRFWNLLAVEDPFDHDNNVAGSVSRAGIDAMKTEFSRALTIIGRAHEIPGAGWHWRTSGGDLGQDLFAEFKAKPGQGQVSERVPDISTLHQPGNRNPPSPRSLIRPAAAEKQLQQTSIDDFGKKASLTAETMHHFLNMPELPNSNALESTGDLAAQSVSNFPPTHFAIDPRQFHGPAAIRDREPWPKRYSEDDDCDSEPQRATVPELSMPLETWPSGISND